MAHAQTVADDSASYRIPLLIGVVGSRALVPAEIPAIRTAIESLLRTLRDAQPDVHIKLLCSLSVGVDLLAAEVADELGISIVSLQAFSAEQCRATLTSDDARVRFDAVLQRAEILEVPPRASVTSADALARQPSEQIGELIALYSSLLIVIWDGNELEDRATARSVNQRLGRAGPSHIAAPDELLFAEDNDLMYEIRCSSPAAGTTGTTEESGTAGVRITGFTTGRRHFGDITAGIPPELATLLERTAGFNADVAALAQSIGAHGQRLMPESGTPRPQALAYVDRLFMCADWLSGYFKRCYVRALQARYVLWATLVALLLIFGNHPEGVLGFASISGVLVVFALSALLASWATRRRWHRRYLDYRALAEGLRVDFYWELGGVRAQFDGAFAHESFLQKQDVELEWIRAAMRAVSLRCALYPRAAVADGLSFTSAAWLGGQGESESSEQSLYYRRRANELSDRESIAAKGVRVMLSLGLAVCLALALDSGLRLAGQPFLSTGSRVVLLAAFALFTAYGAIFGIYFDERVDRALLRQYRHMDALFASAARELRAARTPHEKREILRSLGRACLAEHAQWILANGDKRVEEMKF